jgi:hypothetical protein
MYLKNLQNQTSFLPELTKPVKTSSLSGFASIFYVDLTCGAYMSSTRLLPKVVPLLPIPLSRAC